MENKNKNLGIGILPTQVRMLARKWKVDKKMESFKGKREAGRGKGSWKEKQENATKN